MPRPDTIRPLAECRILNIPRITDPRGNLSFVESMASVPFGIRRAYWIYAVPGGDERGRGHAYRELQEFIIPLSGSFRITVTDGAAERVFEMNKPYAGLFVPNTLWRTIDNFATNSLCLILASDEYNTADYIYEFAAFCSWRLGAGQAS